MTSSNVSDFDLGQQIGELSGRLTGLIDRIDRAANALEQQDAQLEQFRRELTQVRHELTQIAQQVQRIEQRQRAAGHTVLQLETDLRRDLGRLRGEFAGVPPPLPADATLRGTTGPHPKIDETPTVGELAAGERARHPTPPAHSTALAHALSSVGETPHPTPVLPPPEGPAIEYRGFKATHKAVVLLLIAALVFAFSPAVKVAADAIVEYRRAAARSHDQRPNAP